MVAKYHFHIIMAVFLPLFCFFNEALSQGTEPKPDLWGYGTYITFKEQGAKFKGYSYTVNYRIVNWGTRDLTNNDVFDVKFYLTAGQISLTSYKVYLGADTLSISLATVGTSEIFSKRITIPDSLSLSATQSFYLTIVLDANNFIDEYNEENNILSSSAPYGISQPPQGVDLTGEKMLFGGSYYLYTGSSYEINY